MRMSQAYASSAPPPNAAPLTAAIVGLFHAEGITVIAWTVDDPATMRGLVAIGVDGITTNRPDLLVAQFPR